MSSNDVCRPQNVRVVDPVGEEIPANLVFLRTELRIEDDHVRPVHVWVNLTPMRPGQRLEIGVMPAYTEIRTCVVDPNRGVIVDPAQVTR